MTKHLIFTLGLAAVCGAAQPQGLRTPRDISTEAWYAVADARGVQLVNVECGANGFDPHEIVVRSNLPVELLVRTSTPSQEFVAGFLPPQAIGPKPTAFRFTPPGLGRFTLSCQTRGAAEDAQSRANKRGLLTVVLARNQPP